MTAVADTAAGRMRDMMAEASVITLVGHTHPDGDALGSTLALRSYLASAGKDAEVVLPDAPPCNLLFLEGADNIICADESMDAALGRISASGLIVCLDFNSPERAGVLADAIRKSDAAKILVDHHIGPSEKDFGLIISNCGISSTSELLFWTLMSMPEIGGDAGRLPADALAALMTGMTTDTNNFANSVYPSTLDMASRILGAGVDRDRIISMLYNRHRENRLRAMGWMLSEGMTVTDSGAAFMIFTQDILDRFGLKDGETEGFVNLPLTLEKVRLSVMLKADGSGGFRVSVRSKEGISANSFARAHFSGGGHELAAGGRLLCPRDIGSSDRETAAAYLLKAIDCFMS